jgi:hypothetical protein
VLDRFWKSMPKSVSDYFGLREADPAKLMEEWRAHWVARQRLGHLDPPRDATTVG